MGAKGRVCPQSHLHISHFTVGLGSYAKLQHIQEHSSCCCQSLDNKDGGVPLRLIMLLLSVVQNRRDKFE